MEETEGWWCIKKKTKNAKLDLSNKKKKEDYGRRGEGQIRGAIAQKFKQKSRGENKRKTRAEER